MPSFPDPETRNVLLPGCARCPGLADCRERIAWGNGPADADVVVVGEAPAPGDPDADRWRGGNQTGMAYTSRHSGRRIRNLFADLGYDPYYTNAVKCFPQDPEDPTTNREPTPAERRRCGAHLRTEIETVDPDVVVATGKHATESVARLAGRSVDGFLDSVVSPLACPELGATLLPILHPSYQEVWLARLGYDREEYRAAIEAQLP
ncbi:uracil-DNA glycosylase [Halobacteriales archaeon QS_1_68_20]|nr:MAG: uracil-DNA glycosylase [Halobacteriales archaeon QS_1_68_20]